MCMIKCIQILKMIRRLVRKTGASGLEKYYPRKATVTKCAISDENLFSRVLTNLSKQTDKQTTVFQRECLHWQRRVRHNMHDVV